MIRKNIIGICSLIIIISLLSTSILALDPSELDNGLEMYYNYDSDAGNSVNGLYNGTVNGAISNSSGKINNAYQFDGVDDYIQSLGPNRNNWTAQTISLWFYPTNNADTDQRIYEGNENSSYGLERLYFNDGGGSQIKYQVCNGVSSCIVATSSAISLNSWYHIVVIRNPANGSINIYINNVSDGANTLASFGDLGIEYSFGSSWAGSPGTTVFGLIDEVAIWSRNLSLEEISFMYNAGNNQLQYPFSGPVLSNGDLEFVEGNLYNGYYGFYQDNVCFGTNVQFKANQCEFNSLSENCTFYYNGTKELQLILNVDGTLIYGDSKQIIGEGVHSINYTFSQEKIYNVQVYTARVNETDFLNTGSGTISINSIFGQNGITCNIQGSILTEPTEDQEVEDSFENFFDFLLGNSPRLKFFIGASIIMGVVVFSAALIESFLILGIIFILTTVIVCTFSLMPPYMIILSIIIAVILYIFNDKK